MKIGVWGLGGHVIKNILPAIAAVEELELVGVLTRNRDVLEKVSREQSCKSWNSYQEMLNDDIDVVYLATPPGFHYVQGLKILNSNKHFWCEKPLALELEHVLHLEKVASRKGLSICEGFMYLYHPQYLRIKEYLTNNLLGNVQSVRIDFGLPEISSPSFRDSLEGGGSCLFDVGSYPFSLISDCFDLDDIKIVYSDVIKNKESNVDSSGVAFMTINSNINCTLEWSYNTAYKNDITIWSEEGTLYSEKIFSKAPDLSPSVHLKNINGSPSIENISASNHFILMLKSFIENSKSLEKGERETKRFTNLALLIDRFRKEIFNKEGD
jgi:predicted dehydrogenase